MSLELDLDRPANAQEKRLINCHQVDVNQLMPLKISVGWFAAVVEQDVVNRLMLTLFHEKSLQAERLLWQNAPMITRR